MAPGPFISVPGCLPRPRSPAWFAPPPLSALLPILPPPPRPTVYPVPSSDPSWVPGTTELIVGRWLAKATAADPTLRARLVIATKVMGYSGSSTVPGYRSDPPVKEMAPARLDAASVRAAAEASLRRLGCGTIDLYQLHWPDRYVPLFGSTVYNPAAARADSVPIAETLGALKALMGEGKIRHWGLSNETSYGVCQAVAAADALGMPRPATIQNSFCLLHRSFETDLGETCSHLNVDLLPWTPLAGGSLAGKYAAGAIDAAPAEEVASWRFKRFPKFQPRYVGKDSLAAVAAYKDIAEEAGMSVATLSLAWCRSRSYVASTIIGATKMAHVKENIDAFDEDLTLSEEVLAKIDKVHLRQRDPATV